MSTSSGRKGDRSRRRNQENNDEDRRERDRTPRRYDHDPATYTTLEELEEDVEQLHLGDRGNDEDHREDEHAGSRQRPSSSSSWSDWNWMDGHPRGYWWRSKKNERDEDIYEYDTESQAPETESIASSSRNYTTARTEDSTSRRATWQSESSNDVRSHREEESYNVESSGHFAEPRSGYSRPGTTQRDSYKSSQPSTKISPGVMSQDVHIGRTVFTGDDDSPKDSRDSAAEGNQQVSIGISGSDIANQSSQLPPVLIPPSSICGCDSRDHLCGVIIFPSHPSPKDGKISSKRSKGKTGSSSKSKSTSSSSSTSGPGSGSGRLSVKGPNGSGCGPIVMPGITPSPKPQPPSGDASGRDWEDYYQRVAQWKEDYEDWKHITCPCRRGYFDEDGKWVSGGEVRRGAAVPNPRWESSDGLAPDVISTKEKYKVKLFERVYG